MNVTFVAAGAFAQEPKIDPLIKGVFSFLSHELGIAPGSHALIIGLFFQLESCSAAGVPFPKELCGVRVWVGEDEAAVFQVTPGSINIVIPVEAEPGETTVVVESQGIRSDPFPVTLDTHAPGLLRAPHRVDPLTDPEVPVAPGAAVTVFAIGLGPTDPPVATGYPGPAAPPAETVETPTLRLGCFTPEVLSASLDHQSPGFYRVNFIVPESAPGGSRKNHSFSLSIGGQTSNEVILPVSGDEVPGVCAVVNAATFAPDALVAPGSIMSLFAMNIGEERELLDIFPDMEFNGVSVTFNNLPAPLFAVDPTRRQINLLAPTELPEMGEIEVRVTNEVEESLSFTLEMTEADPGIFRVHHPADLERVFAAATLGNTKWFALPQDAAEAIGLPINCTAAGVNPLAFCAEPVQAGDTLSVFVTGLGRATVGGDPDGAVLPTGELPPGVPPLFETVHEPVVTFDEVPGRVTFSGLAPGNAGLYQINVKVPEGAPTGDAVPLTLAMPNGRSDTASVAIRP